MRVLLPQIHIPLSPGHLLVFDAPVHLCHQIEQGLGSMETVFNSCRG